MSKFEKNKVDFNIRLSVYSIYSMYNSSMGQCWMHWSTSVQTRQPWNIFLSFLIHVQNTTAMDKRIYWCLNTTTNNFSKWTWKGCWPGFCLTVMHGKPLQLSGPWSARFDWVHLKSQSDEQIVPVSQEAVHSYASCKEQRLMLFRSS